MLCLLANINGRAGDLARLYGGENEQTRIED